MDPSQAKYSTWMLHTEATLMKFYAESKGFLYKMAHVRTTFNAYGYLIFCDETLVSLGYKISIINEYASIHNTPRKKSSSDSLLSKLKLGKFGRGSPNNSMDKQKHSAEDSKHDKYKYCIDDSSP